MRSRFQNLALDIMDRIGIQYRFVPRPRIATEIKLSGGRTTPYKYRIPTRDYMWDGKFLSIYPNNAFSLTMHEIAHWLVATPAERRAPEYGLGTPPELTRCTPEEVYKCDFVETELQASALGIALEKHLGYPHWRKSADNQNWNMSPDAPPSECIETFWKEEGLPRLYNKKGVPRVIGQWKRWLQSNPNYQ